MIHSEYNFKSHFFEIGGHRLHYLDEGEGPVLIFLHGNPTWSFYWRNLLNGLKSQYRVIALDHLGCGFSDKPQDYVYRLENHIQNTTALLDHLRVNDVTLFLHDWGGAIGMGYAAERPENIKRLVLFNTAAFTSNEMPLRLSLCRIPVFSKFLIQRLNAFAWGATRLATTKGLKPETRRGYLHPYDNYENRIATYEFVQDIPLSKNHPSWNTLRRVEEGLTQFKKKPVSLIWGGKDFVFHEGFLQEWQRRFPEAESHVFKEAGHYVVEDAREEVMPIVKNFLDRTVMPFNVSRHLRNEAQQHPDRAAVVRADGVSISFSQLDAECDRLAALFQRRGVRAGTRVAVFVKPGFEFVPTIFGLFRLGAIPVCIDPGMKLKNILACVAEAAPEVLVGVPLALALARFFPRAFRAVKIRVRVPKIRPAKIRQATSFTPYPTSGGDEAALLFTSGSTGIPKGVVYTHEAFDGQQRALRAAYQILDEEKELVVFPLFALFSAAWGITAVIPRMNPARPAKTSGKHLAALIQKYRITHAAGSPAIWKNLVEYCEKHKLTLPTLKRILMAGAQVPEKLVMSCARIASEVHTPYGATEALPLTTISHTELRSRYEQTRRGAGTCVGKALPGVEIAIIPFIDASIPLWEDSLRQGPYVKGEVTVKSPWVTTEYFSRREATKKAKILSPEGGVWHRMGDVGYLDEENNLWFCGRKDHRVFSPEEILYPDPIEAIFDNHPAVFRSAVVGVGPKGSQKAILVVQKEKGVACEPRVLQEFSEQFFCARTLAGMVFTEDFPVDVRHNIKIDRPKLAKLIEEHVL